jgi:hypothetical protein
MISETKHVHMLKVNMNLIKNRNIRLYLKVGPVPEAPDALLPAGADMLDRLVCLK